MHVTEGQWKLLTTPDDDARSKIDVVCLIKAKNVELTVEEAVQYYRWSGLVCKLLQAHVHGLVCS